MTRLFWTVILLLIVTVNTYASNSGILITSDETGEFEYVDDFSTPQVFRDAFLDNVSTDCWQEGSITNQGPHGNRTITYRFYGDRVITRAAVEVQQEANGGNLGGRNLLYLSGNGLDWTIVANSGDQEGDANGWQREPLTAAMQQTSEFMGSTELWVRIVLDNFSGLETGTSNVISHIRVSFKVGEEPSPAAEPQAEQLALWGRLRAKAGWRTITLDCHDPVDQHPPHYYEDSDGWLQPSGVSPYLLPDERNGFPVQRAYIEGRRSPLSLATFVKLNQRAAELMARIVVRCTRESSRQMNVLWDGQVVDSFDIADYFETDKPFFVQFPGPQNPGRHELRITGSDSGHILVREISLTSQGELSWATKPALPAGNLDVLSAYYIPDPAPPPASQAVEGRHKAQDIGLIIGGMQRLYKEYNDFGAVRVIVRNSSSVPVRISGLQLDGKPVEESYVDFVKSDWDAAGVVWYRIRPRTLAPHQCAQVYIRFRHRPVGDQATVTVHSENAPAARVSIHYRRPEVMIDYVTTDESMKILYVYARRYADDAGRITGLSLDGRPLNDVTIYGADYPGSVALAVAKLSRPLQPGSYHVIAIERPNRSSMAAQFRVLPFFFPRTSIHVPPELCEEMHMNLAMWHQQSLETCKKYGLYTTSGNVFDLHPRVAYVLGPDEPDAHDNRGGGYARGLGSHARRLAHSGWQELIQRFAPDAATWIIMNGTVRPLNWCVYGQFADISCFDPYPVTYYGADHAYVRESLSYARKCGAPNRMYACLEAFGWQKGPGVPSGTRGPIPAEYRQNIVQAIGVGMKGLTSWVYVGSAGGWQINEACKQEIAECNALIEHIQGYLLLGTPVDLASSDAGLVPTGVAGEEHWPKERVWVGSLLCGPDTIVVAAANHIPASKPGPPDIKPAEDVTITVNLPHFLTEVNVLEVTADGLVPFGCRVSEGKALLHLDAISSGRVFVLQRRQ